MTTFQWLVTMLLLLHILNFVGNNYALSGERSSENTSFPIATNGQPFPWNKLRLPDWILPVHYDLLIHPNLTSLRFMGSVKIQVTVVHETSTVVLHSKHLEITSAAIEEENGKTQADLKQIKVLEYLPHEQIAFLYAEPLRVDKKYFLSINYIANLSDGFYGFYKSTYKTKDGQTRLLASTHFEPTSARLAFPCFDEPSFKANYTIKIRRDGQHSALSNMPKVKTLKLDNNLFEDHFAESVKMSTYLVAFIVSDFQSVSGTTSSGIKVSVYVTPEKLNQAHYALEAAIKILEFYEQYFGIYYPLPKQDLVAVPDFQSGAMENWGLTTYRETSLLYDPETSSASDKLWVTMVIGHELAHQWFGNLVTMEWWNDIWLNEGFARYMEFISVDAMYPELQVNDYLLGTCFAAMGRDSMNSSHPISSKAENPTQIKEMFDTVSYDKTCSEEDFTSGKFCYSKSQVVKNAHSYYIDEHFDIAEIMNTWTLQKGIPLIIVEQNQKRIKIRQERFLKGIFPHDPQWASMQIGFLWHVPLTYITSHSKSIGRHLLKNHSDTIELEEDVNWVKFNVDMNGYYIVHYEGNGWDAIIELLNQNHTIFSYKDRANLIHNAFQLVSAGRLSLDRALDLTQYLQHESSNIVLLQGLGYLAAIYRMMERRNISDVTESLKRYILQHFKLVIDRQTWSDEGSISDRMLRSALLELACDLQYPPCVQKANELFSKWMGSGGNLTNIPSDVLETVYSVGSKTADGWNFLLERYKVSMSGAEQRKICSALASCKDDAKLTRLLELAMEGHIIKTQDLSSVIYSVSTNPIGQHLAWKFVKKNWSKLLEKFPLGSFSIRTIIIGVTAQFSSKQELEEVKLFFESVKEKVSQLRAPQIAVENIEKNIKWLERNLVTLTKWILENLK
ncbi:endoplasmic reticulum aminopeptidase 2-like isoform X2 [Dermochelys coriacea]|uniref:endoplasmic reticulum aminopeptidase 2-like isoform X2 n=1 Tax=Dermochelys coriacea TaxID=27794 RepID=UPI0018E8A9FB|nr:endoplasmic reticulum aminopeptidase 2-like isoform X2 [Dermochelys coriacea]